jgi:hypothetical protein
MNDASKKVTPEGLVLLGWRPIAGSPGSYVYPAVDPTMGYYPDNSGGVWWFAGQCRWGKLAPRTLAEVKFLMERVLEDDVDVQ